MSINFQAYIWDQWFDLIQPYASLIPYMVGVGNHEQDHINGHEKDPSKQPNFRPAWFNGHTDSGGECGVPSVNRFHMPDNGLSLYWYDCIFKFDLFVCFFRAFFSISCISSLYPCYTLQVQL